MPRMDGIALGQKVGADYPGIEVLYISGFILDAPKHHIPIHCFLPKPFAPDVLVQRLVSLGGLKPVHYLLGMGSVAAG
jgi:hypothetical protein